MLKPMMGEMMEEELEDLDLKAEDLPDFPYFMLGWAKRQTRSGFKGHSFPLVVQVISPFRSFVCRVSFFCLAYGLTGEEKPRFLLSPSSHEGGWNARILKHHDLNKDGLEDLAYYNLDRSRIEFLYRTKDGKVPPRVRSAQPDRWEPLSKTLLTARNTSSFPRI